MTLSRASSVVNFGSPQWVLVLLVFLVLIALPTGFSAAFLPWFCVEIAGAAMLFWLSWRDEYECAFRAWRMAGPLSAWLGLSILIAAIQIFSGATESRFDTFRQLHFFAGGLLLIPLVARALPALKSTAFQQWASPAACTLLLVSLLAGSLAATQPNPADDAVFWWPFVYRNHYAAFVLLVLPVLCWQVFTQPKSQWSAAVGIVAGLTGIVSSASRSGIVLLALTLGAFLLLLWLRSARKWQMRVIVTTLAVAALAVGLANHDGISWRLANAGSLLEGRLDYWQASLHMITERPWLGWGYGTWPEVYLQFLVRDTGLVVNHAHSDWLEYFAEGGLLPTLALVALFARSVWLASRHLWFLGVPAVLLQAMADYPLRLPILLLVMVLLYVAAEFAEQLPTHREARENHLPWNPASIRGCYSKPPTSAELASATGSSTGSGIACIIASTFRWKATRRL